MKDKATEQQIENEITPEQDELMRKLANLILDRVYDDFDNGVLKFQDE